MNANQQHSSVITELNWIELFLWCGWPTKGVYPLFQPRPLTENLTIANLRHAASRVWTWAEPEFRLYWMKLCSCGNHYNTNNGRVVYVFRLKYSFQDFFKIVTLSTQGINKPLQGGMKLLKKRRKQKRWEYRKDA